MKLRDALLTVVLVMVAILLWRRLAADRPINTSHPRPE
jgi:hypothetical protein